MLKRDPAHQVCQPMTLPAALSILTITPLTAMDPLASTLCPSLGALPQPFCFPALLANYSSPVVPLLLCHFLQGDFLEILPSIFLTSWGGAPPLAPQTLATLPSPLLQTGSFLSTG